MNAANAQRNLVIKNRLFVILHKGLRILPAVMVFVLIALLNLPFVAYILIALTKWRMVACRPQFWWFNLQINAVDLIVALSLAYFMAWPGLLLWQQFVWLAVYLLWVLVIRSIKKQNGRLIQGLAAQVLGSTILVYSLASLNFIVALLGFWLVAFLAARHILNGFPEEKYHNSLVYVWSIFSLQLAWILSHWQTNFWIIPQLVFLQTLIMTTAFAMYSLYRENKLTDFVKKQVVWSVLGLVVVTLLASSLHQIFF